MSDAAVNFEMSPFPGDWAEAVACARQGLKRTWEGGDVVFHQGREVNRYRYQLAVTGTGRVTLVIVSDKLRTGPLSYMEYAQRHGARVVRLVAAIKKRTVNLLV